MKASTMDAGAPKQSHIRALFKTNRLDVRIVLFGVRKRALCSIRHTHDCLADVVPCCFKEPATGMRAVVGRVDRLNKLAKRKR